MRFSIVTLAVFELLNHANIASGWLVTSLIRRQNARYHAIRNVRTQLSSSEDEELIRLIRGPLGNQAKRPLPKTIFILSDTTGVTAKAAVQKSLEQFNGCDQRFANFIEEYGTVDLQHDLIDEDESMDEDEECEMIRTKVYPFLSGEESIVPILRQAEELRAMVVFTLADPVLREKASQMCELSRLNYVDLLGPMFDSMASFFDRKAFGQPSLQRYSRRALSDSYYRRVEAVEFTLKCDDGMSPRLLSEADVIILGVSRTGKTPLSVVLSQTMGLKVANIPLVVDLPPPAQLFAPEIDPRRVFCLTLNPDDLITIRQARLGRQLRHAQKWATGGSGAAKSTYADREYVKRDLANARKIAMEYGYTEIDVTGRAVEETASWISSLLYERFPFLNEG